MIELVTIGERFYKESQTMMSPIYREDPKGVFHRYDYGFLHLDANAGKEIHIRPANEKELKFFERKLNEHFVKMGHQRGMKCQIHDVETVFNFIIPEIGKPLVMDE